MLAGLFSYEGESVVLLWSCVLGCRIRRGVASRLHRNTAAWSGAACGVGHEGNDVVRWGCRHTRARHSAAIGGCPALDSLGETARVVARYRRLLPRRHLHTKSARTSPPSSRRSSRTRQKPPNPRETLPSLVCRFLETGTRTPSSLLRSRSDRSLFGRCAFARSLSRILVGGSRLEVGQARLASLQWWKRCPLVAGQKSFG